MQIAAIVLAAGGSSRLQSHHAGQAKQLLQRDGEFFVDRAVRLATEAGCAPLIVVLGAHAEHIRREARLHAHIVVNDAWQQGMASSIHAGITALQSIAPAAEAVLLMTCDQYALTATDLRALIAAAHQEKIIAAEYGGTAGIPAIFPRGYFQQLLSLTGDRGARALLLQHSDHVVRIACANAVLDLDTPEDLRRL